MRDRLFNSFFWNTQFFTNFNWSCFVAKTYNCNIHVFSPEVSPLLVNREFVPYKHDLEATHTAT
jgi:hypothetical protein